MSTWLITGARGFLGRHLLERLAVELGIGCEIYALTRTEGTKTAHRVQWVRGDLGNRQKVLSIVETIRPTHVVHLAGATPPTAPEQLYQANVRNTAHLLDGLGRLTRPVRFVMVGSAAELGPVPEEHLPVGEDQPCRPETPYGLSKWAAMAMAMGTKRPIEAMGARLFNPIGPGMPTSQALGRFASILATAKAEPIRLKVGDLEARRDFVDVRDVATALMLLGFAGQVRQSYHVGTGQSRPVREGLEYLVALSQRSVVIESSTLPGQPSGPRDSRARIDRLREELGWEPRVDFRSSLRDHWREMTGQKPLTLIDSPAFV